MTRPPARKIVAAALSLVLLGAGASMLLHDDKGSAFAQGPGSVFVEEASMLGHDATRLISTPLSLRNDGSLDPAATLVVVLDSSRPFSTAEVAAYERFLEAGGSMLVVDSTGHANSLTGTMGIIFERVRLVEPHGSVPVHIEGREHTATLQSATSLKIDNGAEEWGVLAWTSDASFLDREGDGAIDAIDPPGPFPLIAEAAVGERGGRLVVVAEPAIITPPGGDPELNREVREALLSHLLPSKGRIVVDESRVGTSHPGFALTALAVVAAMQPPWGALLGAALVAAAAAAWLHPAVKPWAAHAFRPMLFIHRSRLQSEEREQAGHAVGGVWTTKGRFAIAAAAFLGVGGVMTGSVHATAAAAMLGVTLAAALLVEAPGLEARRDSGGRMVAERTPVLVQATLKLRKPVRRPIEIRDHLPQSFNVESGNHWMRITGRRKQEIPVGYTCKPARMGPFMIGPLVARSMDPFRLRVHDAELAPASKLHVTPLTESIRRQPFSTRVPSILMGPHPVNRAGDGSEFLSLRDYQTGDSLRIVNWKASARSKNLVVNQRVHETRTTLTLAVDARLLAGAGPDSLSPHVCAARIAATLARSAMRTRNRVRFVLYGDRIHKIGPSGSANQVHQIETLLSSTPCKGSVPFRAVVEDLLPDLRPNMPFVLVTGMEGDPTVAQGLRRLGGHGMRTTLITCPIHTRPEGDEEGAPEPDEQRILTERETTMEAIKNAGAMVYEYKPGVPLEDLIRITGAA